MRGRGPGRRFGALALAALLGSACASGGALLSREPEPYVSAAGLTVQSLSKQHCKVEVSLEIENPGAELRVRSAETELLLQGRPFAGGLSALNEAIAARARSQVKLELSFAYLELPGRGRAQVRRGEPLKLVVRGVLRASGPAGAVSIPFDAEVEHPWEEGADDFTGAGGSRDSSP